MRFIQIIDSFLMVSETSFEHQAKNVALILIISQSITITIIYIIY